MTKSMITGVKSQDGSCLARSLLQKGYKFMVGKEEQLQISIGDR
jgi:GDP-D-mannose dehydratase